MSPYSEVTHLKCVIDGNTTRYIQLNLLFLSNGKKILIIGLSLPKIFFDSRCIKCTKTTWSTADCSHEDRDIKQTLYEKYIYCTDVHVSLL